MPKRKPKNRRSATEYPALKKQFNLKTRADAAEIDYLHKLNDKEKEWLNNFTEERVNANFNHKGKIIHKTKALRKECYDMNNARNRCILTRAKASGQLVSIHDYNDGEFGFLEDLDEKDDSTDNNE